MCEITYKHREAARRTFQEGWEDVEENYLSFGSIWDFGGACRLLVVPFIIISIIGGVVYLELCNLVSFVWHYQLLRR